MTVLVSLSSGLAEAGLFSEEAEPSPIMKRRTSRIAHPPPTAQGSRMGSRGVDEGAVTGGGSGGRGCVVVAAAAATAVALAAAAASAASSAARAARSRTAVAWS